MNPEVSILLRSREACIAVTSMLISGGDVFRVEPRTTVHGYEVQIFVQGEEPRITQRVWIALERIGEPVHCFRSIKFYRA